MIWIAIVLGVLVGSPILFAAIGMLLPRDHVAQKTVRFAAPPEKVWALVSDVAGTARWRPSVRTVELKRSDDGKLRFVETSRHGAIPFEVVSQEPPRRQVVRVVDDDQPFGGTWTWELTPDGGGTRISITEAGFVKNPVFRVMGKLFFSPTKTIETYLTELEKALGESTGV